MGDTYNYDFLWHITFRFYLIDFELHTDFPSQILLFYTVKSPFGIQRSVSQEDAFKKRRNLSPFLGETIGS